MMTRRRKFGVTALALLPCAALAIGYSQYRDFTQQLRGYAGLTLGDSREEVLYKLGHPVFVAAAEEPGAQWRRIFYTDREKDQINAMPVGTTITQYPQWSYEGPGARPHRHRLQRRGGSDEH